jgi:putative DNA primase/helicase
MSKTTNNSNLDPPTQARADNIIDFLSRLKPGQITTLSEEPQIAAAMAELALIVQPKDDERPPPQWAQEAARMPYEAVAPGRPGSRVEYPPEVLAMIPRVSPPEPPMPPEEPQAPPKGTLSAMRSLPSKDDEYQKDVARMLKGLEADALDNDFGGGDEKHQRPPPPPNPNDLPEIEIRAGQIERIVNETEAALLAEQETAPVAKRLFRRGGMVVSIGFNTEPTHDGGTVEAQIIVETGDYALTERIAAAAIFKKYNERKKKLVRVDPPHTIAATLKQRRYNLKFPALVAVVNCPQFTANGQIMATPGYNPKTGIFYDPRGVSFPSVSAHPTAREVKAALQTIKRPYHTFSFETEIDRAVAISLPLTLVARTGIETSPLHGFDAHVAGSGKSKLVSIASIIATGHDAGVIAQGETREEFEKRLATQLMKGKQLIAIDNCNSPLDGDLLNQALTQGQLEMRVLGESRDIVTRCATVIAATGNNLIIVGDLTRRSLNGGLDPKVERPELQQFDYDPIADAKDNRGELVAAALTILRAYHAAGRPGRLPQLQSFAGWSDMVRSAMTWIGLDDPVKTQEKLRENDPKLLALIRVASAWRMAFGVETRTTGEAIADAEERTSIGASGEKWVPANPVINEAFMSVAGRNRAINPVVLGNYLSASTGRVVRLDDAGQV